MAKEMEKAKPEGEAAEPQKGKGKKGLMKWIVIGVAALVVIGGGVFGGKYYLDQGAAKKEAEKKPPPIGTLWATEPFIVNLMDNEGERFLKVVLQLELSDPECGKELDVLKPKVRDTILGILTIKSLKDITGSEGKQRLKEDIAIRLNNLLSRGRIVQVYFTDFVIQ